MAVRPRVMEQSFEIAQVTKEATVEAATEAVPVGRFIKAGATAGTIRLATTLGERVLGVSLESGYAGETGARTGEFDDYAIGDKCPYGVDPEEYVYIECSNQAVAAPALTDLITTDADGKAIVTTTTGHFVAGVNPELHSYGGVKFYRFMPTWKNLKVVP